MSEELVLVVSNDNTSPLFKKDFKYISKYLDPSTMNYIQDQIEYSFMPRSMAEVSLNYVQIIPYVTIFHQGKILTYERGTDQGEKRLHGKRSVGIGGHINPVDITDYQFNKLVYNCMMREIDEEIIISDGINLKSKFNGFIYDDSTDVGRVHFGLSYFIDILEKDVSVTAKEKSMLDTKFLSIDELKKDILSYENWSQKIIQASK